MNRDSFSWNRLLDVSASKGRLSREIGAPLTRSGRERKLGAAIGYMASCKWCGQQLSEGVRFCGSCGTPHDIQIKQTSQVTVADKPSSGVPEDSALPLSRQQGLLDVERSAQESRTSSVQRRNWYIIGGVLIVGVVGICMAFTVDSGSNAVPSTSAGDRDSVITSDREPSPSTASTPPTSTTAIVPASAPEPVAPPSQKSFASMIDSFIPTYNAADTEIRKTDIRFRRKDAIADYFSRTGNPQFRGWVGEVDELKTEQDGEAHISIKLQGSSDIHIQTWNNSLSDSDSRTMISRNDPPYRALMNIKTGDIVTVSGMFLLDRKHDFVTEGSLTENGSMTEPEFIVKFSQISKGATPPEAQPIDH